MPQLDRRRRRRKARNKRPKRVTFRVSLGIPRGALVRDVRAYMEDAVCTWRGGLRPPGSLGDLDPGDPLFDLDPDSVDVTYLGPDVGGAR